MRASRVCAEPGCPVLGDTTRCPEHQRATEARRGNFRQRGYGSDHDRLRRRWAPAVATGTVPCWRCHRLIAAGQPWHLGHLDGTSEYGGPEHQLCNTSAAGRSSHGLAPQPTTTTRETR